MKSALVLLLLATSASAADVPPLQYSGDPRCVGGFSPCIYDFPPGGPPDSPPDVPPPHGVPEPGTLALLTCGLAAMARRKA
jgi:PEP-CTERM motif-containing protein